MSSWAQQATTVKGTVKDAENNPVIGATVVVKGTTLGTTTDIDGNYTINVSQGQVLEFSYVGMQQSDVTIGNKNVINVTMADGELLDEVVVIGYGTVKKKNNAYPQSHLLNCSQIAIVDSMFKIAVVIS